MDGGQRYKVTKAASSEGERRTLASSSHKAHIRVYALKRALEEFQSLPAHRSPSDSTAVCSFRSRTHRSEYENLTRLQPRSP
ncbi:hypothetical protein AAFF_G00173880 [Aldrovandia affinis]|uniref:Uncharacterized protein n=1 Tax=Aldrovandia affinis TaxID=143900 RepID=A0AAD7T086_9TELE|nr:hypothetical protein AAFF_G00173880 [Aldrovandia affinis]